MRDSTAYQKRHAPCLWTKKTETEKGRRKGEDQGKFNRISLVGETTNLHAYKHVHNNQHIAISATIATTQLGFISWNGINDTWVSSKDQIVWSTAMR
jgi:hypothetical protein